MKPLKMMVLFVLAFLIVGCGDETTYGDNVTNNYNLAPSASVPQPAPDANVETDAGVNSTDAQPDAIVETDANDTDAQAEAVVENDAEVDSNIEVDGAVEPDAEIDSQVVDNDADAGEEADVITRAPILTVIYIGPIPDKEAAGGLSNALYRCTFCTTKLIEIVEHGFLIDPQFNSSGRTQGSNNTKYFSQFIEQYTGGTVAGPKDLNSLPGDTMPRSILFHEPHQIAAGTCETFTIRAQLANTEDAPGEFIEQSYSMYLYSIGAQVLAGGDEPSDRWLYNDEFKFGNLQGDVFTIKSCFPGTFTSCTCGNGNAGQSLCSVSYEPLACQCE